MTSKYLQMSKVLINQVWSLNSDKYRVLYADQEIDLILWVKLDDELKTFPNELSFDELNELQLTGKAKEVDHYDMFVDTSLLDKKSLAKFHDSWNIIKDVVYDEPMIFDRSYFNSKCSELAEKNGVSRHTVNRLIQKYWRSGKSKLGIIPKYYNSGGKGKEKNLSQINGRQRSDQKVSSILDDKTKTLIKKGYKRWYLKVKQASKKTAYYNFIRVNFKDEWRAKNFSNVPSFRQFSYWGEKGLETETKLRSKKGNVIFDKDLRLLEGSSFNSVNGPGTSQIDSTRSDVELISEIDGSPIGCPTIYIVSDVYSAMFLGVLVTLENESYVQAMEALYNSFCNKGDFFQRSLLYQIPDFSLTSEDWPCEYIPNSIVTDRGSEFMSSNTNNLIANLGIHIENKESYRPELKGMIERQFELIHKNLKGSEENIGMKDKDDGRRGARKARKTAIYTLREYLAIVVNNMVEHNKTYRLKNYPLDKEMPLDNLYVPSPEEVFKWGVLNKSGKLRSNNIKNLKELMLPTEKAKLTKEGIEFYKGWYILPLNHKLRDLQLKTQNKRVYIDVSYDPYNLNQIHLLYNGEVINCNLNLQKSKIYENRTLWEIKQLIKTKSIAFNQKEENVTYQSIKTLEFTANLRKGKKKNGNVTPNKESLRKSREKDKQLERKNRTQSTGTNKNEKDAKIVRMDKRADLSQPDYLDFIDKLLDGE